MQGAGRFLEEGNGEPNMYKMIFNILGEDGEVEHSKYNINTPPHVLLLYLVQEQMYVLSTPIHFSSGYFPLHKDYLRVSFS